MKPLDLEEWAEGLVRSGNHVDYAREVLDLLDEHRRDDVVDKADYDALEADAERVEEELHDEIALLRQEIEALGAELAALKPLEDS